MVVNRLSAGEHESEYNSVWENVVLDYAAMAEMRYQIMRWHIW